MTYDFIVIGAGPAGMKAALKAVEFGAKVAVIDENEEAGGKLLGQLHEEPTTGWWIGQNIAQELTVKAKIAGVHFYLEQEVWAISPNWVVHLNKGESLKADCLLIATGAAEKAIPLSGWTLPGVMAIGAAQVLNNYHRVKPGNKIAIIGMDPLALTVAHELKLGGAEVTGIFLPPPNDFSGGKSNPIKMIKYLSTMAHLAPGNFLKAAGKLAASELTATIGARVFPTRGIRVWGIPLYLKKTILEIEGDGQVERIRTGNVTSGGTVKSTGGGSMDVDCVCISGGLYPLSELASAAGCQFAYVEELGGHVPIHNTNLETTKSGVFVAGNITGIEGAKVALAQGELAGTAVSARLGLLDDREEKLLEQARIKIEEARSSSAIKFLPDIKQGREKMIQRWNECVNGTLA